MVDVSVASNPIKMYEYLASGKHVVSTDIPEARNIPSVHIGEDHTSFINKIGYILHNKIPFNNKEVEGWLVVAYVGKKIYGYTKNPKAKQI